VAALAGCAAVLLRARGDRVRGMAVLQAGNVHRGVAYDLEVDTASATSEARAREIAIRLDEIARPG
jgi:chloramphenicol 3-O phosphotransferase